MLFYKNLVVQEDQVVFLYKKSILQDVLFHGKHRVPLQATFKGYCITERFVPEVNLDVILKNKWLNDYLDVIVVKDHERLIQWKDGVFNSVLRPGKYAFWKGVYNFAYQSFNLNDLEFGEDIPVDVLYNTELRHYVNIQRVEAYEKAVLMVNNIYLKTLESGTYNFIVGSNKIELKKIDMRKCQMEINGQELLTKDKANIRINFQASFKVIDVDKALKENQDYNKQLYILFQLALRSYIGEYSLDELLANKSKLDQFIIEAVKIKSSDLGLKVLHCGIKDIILPGDVKDIMNQVLIAEKKAQANMIMRREETASTRNLLNTAKLMQDNDMLYRLKEMEYVEKISDNIQNVTLSGNGYLIDQMKGLFSKPKTLN